MKISLTVFKIQSGHSFETDWRTDKSYGSCCLHIVWWCFIFLWSFMKTSWMVFKFRVDAKWPLSNFKGECTAVRHLMMLYISMKFHDTILNDFLVIEQTQNHHCQISKGNNSKNVWTRVKVLVVCTSSNDALYFYEVSLKYFKRFSSYRGDTILWQTDGLMDRYTDNQGKNNMYPPLSGGGDINIY